MAQGVDQNIQWGVLLWDGSRYFRWKKDKDGNPVPDYRVGENSGQSGLFGGSEAGMRAGVERLQNAGLDAMSLYSGLSQNIQAQQGQYAGQVQDAASNAFDAQQAVTGDMAGIQKQQQGFLNTLPADYGSLSTLGDWRNATREAGDYQYRTSGLTSDAAAALQNYNAGQVTGTLGDSYSALRQYADRGMGDSAAQAQLNAALGQNTASQMALASSGRNAGGNAMAMRQAMANAADLGQNTAAEQATLRANEEANWRAQQLSALGAASGVAGNVESAQQGRNAQRLTAAQSAADLYAGIDAQSNALTSSAQQFAAGQYGSQYQAQAATRQAADTMRQNALGQVAANQQQQYGQVAGNYGTLGDATKSAAAMASAANTQSISALGTGTAAKQGYDQSVFDIYTGNADRSAAAAAQDKDIQASANAAGALRDERNMDRTIGALGSAASVAATAYGGQ